MSDTPHAEGHDPHAGHGPNVQTYMMIFGALVICTLVSFVFNVGARYKVWTDSFSFVVILAVAILKATLVAMYFMHLKVDWNRLYFLIVPALILGPLLVIVLLPDTVLGWRYAVLGP